MSEYFETGSKIGRGMAQRSLDLIEAMRAIAEGGAADHRARHRLQAVHARPDPVDVHGRHAEGLPPSADCPRAGHHPVGMDR